MSPMIKSPWEEIPFFTGGHPRVAGVSFKRVLGKAREVTVSDDTLCLLNLLQDVLWLKKKKKRQSTNSPWDLQEMKVKCQLRALKLASGKLTLGNCCMLFALTSLVVVFHTPCDATAWPCSLVHDHAPFGEEDYRLLIIVCGQTIVSCCCLGCFVFYTCLCCEPNLYLKS